MSSKHLSIVIDLKLSKDFKFYLTGSRFFTPFSVEPTTDWDFFVEESDKVRNYLAELGFVCTGKSHKYSGDPSTVEVWSAYPNGERNHVDIQLVHPKEMLNKINVQENIKRLFGEDGGHLKDKELAKKIWSLGMVSYRQGSMTSVRSDK